MREYRVGLLILFFFGPSTALLRDIPAEPRGSEKFFYWLMACAMICLLVAFVAWLVRLKGEAYVALRSAWERPAALLGLILLSPILLVVGILIRLESSGPMLYRQERVGKNRRKGDRRSSTRNSVNAAAQRRRQSDRRQHDLGGEVFTMYKLRSMRSDAEDGIGAAWSSGDGDPRVTRVGYFVRKTHLDEVPQLCNIILGNMSLIGPRPERPVFVGQLSTVVKDYRRRLEALPGITGLAQVLQDYDETLEDVEKKVHHDITYIANTSLLVDIKIIFLTVMLFLKMFWVSLMKEKPKTELQPKSAQSVFAERTHLEGS